MFYPIIISSDIDSVYLSIATNAADVLVKTMKRDNLLVIPPVETFFKKLEHELLHSDWAQVKNIGEE